MTSYWPVPMCFIPVTPLPATSVPDRLTLAYRLELAASAGAALARPMIAGAAKVAATAPVVSAIRLRRRALVPVNMKCLPYEMRRRMCRPRCWRAGDGADMSRLLGQAGQHIGSHTYVRLRELTTGQAGQSAARTGPRRRAPGCRLPQGDGSRTGCRYWLVTAG